MSTNLSKERREANIEKLSQIKAFLQNSNDVNAQRLLGFLGDLEHDIQTKKYGLVFEEHKEEIDEILEQNVPVLTEKKDLFVDGGGELNFLLEGDNLASLRLLEKTHRGKIDVIYIDPPYNTGAKNWKYNNDYVDKDDTFRHSKFSSFIKERLEIASKLLRRDGIIAIAIDDYEMQNVRLLCDEIFGESNRITTCVVIHNPGGRQDDKFFATTHEYMLVYAKDINCANVGFLDITEEKKSQYKEHDEFGNYKIRSLIRTGAHSRPDERPGLSYPIYIDTNTCDISINKDDKYTFEVLPIDSTGNPRVWRWGPKTLMEKKDKYILCKKSKNGYSIYVKEREDDNKGYKPKTLWFNPNYSSASAIGQIKNIFNTPEGTVFDYPKSLYLISDIVKILSKPESLILDFFAGSGTTGHAVLKLNSEDGGHRKFILCTNNENNICRDITYERIKTVITGKRKDGSKYSDGYKSSLKYLKVDFVNITEKFYYEYADELLEHVKELVELENAINFDKDKTIAICLTEEEIDKFTESINGNTKLEKIYLGHDIQLTDKQNAMFENLGIEIIQIPEYYYNEE